MRQVFIPAVLCLIDIALHCVHEGAVYLSTWPLADCASLVNLEQLAERTEKLALEIPPLVIENLEVAPETREDIIDRRRVGNHSRLRGQGDEFHTLSELVYHHQDILITTWGKGPRKSSCTFTMGAPAWYLRISA